MPEAKDAMARISGLNDDEMRVYSLIMTTGNLTSGDLSLLTKLPLDAIEKVLMKLQKDKLVVAIKGVTSRYQAVPPFDGLAREVEDIDRRVERVRGDLRKQVKTASDSIRTDLTKITDSLSQSIDEQEPALKAQRVQSIDSLKKTAASLTRKLGDTSNSFDKSLQGSYDEWKNEVASVIDPLLVQMKNTVSSSSTLLTGHIKNWSATARNSIENAGRDIVGNLDGLKKTTAASNESRKTAITRAIDKKQEDIRSEMEVAAAALGQHMAAIGAEAKTTFTTVSEGFSDSLTESENRIAASLDSSAGQTRTLLETAKGSVVSSVEKSLEAERTGIQELETGIASGIDKFQDSVKTSTDGLTSSVAQASTQFGQKSETVFSAIDGQLGELASSSQSQMTGAMDRMRTVSGDALQAVVQTTTKISKELSQESTAALDRARDAFKTDVTSTGNALGKLSQDSLTMQQSLLENSDSALIGELESILEKNTALIREVARTTVEELQQMSRTLQEQITSTIDAATNGIQHSAETAASEMNESIGNEKERVSALIREQIAQCQSSHGNLQSEIEKVATQQMASHDETIRHLSTRTASAVDHLVTEVDEIRRQRQGDMDARLGELKKTALDSVTKMSAETKQLTQAHRDNLQEILRRLTNASTGAATQIQDTGTLSVNEFRKGVSGLVARLEKTMEETARGNREELESATQSCGQQMSNVLADAKEQIGVVMTDTRDETTAELTSIKQKTEQTLSEAAEDASGRIMSGVSQLAADLTSLKTDLSTSIDASDAEMTRRSGESLKQLDDVTKTLINSIESSTRSTEKEMASQSEAVKQSIDTAGKQLMDSVTATADGFRGTAVTAVMSSLNSSKTELESAQSGIVNGLESSWDTVQGALETLRRDVNQVTEGVAKSDALGMTEEALMKAFPTPTAVEGEGTGIAKMLRANWDRISATDFPGAKKTWNMTTQRAVLAHIEDMIARAKSKVTLIVPSYDELPIDLLKKSKTTIGIEIVVTEEPKLVEKARPILGKGNIRVRSRTERDVYACIRDSEEALLAPAASKAEDIVGVVTEDDGFVRFIMGIVGPIFQSKTKLLRPEDA